METSKIRHDPNLRNYQKIIMKKILLISALTIISLNAIAFTKNVILGDNLCTNDKKFCMKATIDHHYGSNKLSLHGRVKQTVGKGILTVYLSSNDGSAYLEKEIDGKYSEIIRMSSDASYGSDRDTEWKVREIIYRT